MRDHILEIEQEGKHLSLYRGFLVISSHGIENGRVAIDDLQALIIGSKGASISTPVLTELSQRGIPVVISGEKYLPQAIVWPLNAHHQTARRMRLQLETPIPLCKRMWQKIVQFKLRAQAEVLRLNKKLQESSSILRLSRQVLSGDRTNKEAIAAKLYWQTLFGASFTRDNQKEYPINTFLNYGYAVVRSSVGRAVAAAGLHPAIGLFHHNRFNPFCLVDDLMEPFRPIIDFMALKLFKDSIELSPTIKKALVSTLRMDMVTEDGFSPLNVCIQRLATSLALSFEANKQMLRIPLSSLPADLTEKLCCADTESCG